MLSNVEEWRDVIGFEERYWISNLGRVQSRQQLLKLHLDKDGYLRCQIWREGTGYYRGVHKLVCTAFNGLPPFEGALALHKDGQNQNNIPSNLYWGTPLQNMEDRDQHGKTFRGETNSQARLTWTDVCEIRRRAMLGERSPILLKAYQISYGYYRQILRNEVRTHS